MPKVPYRYEVNWQLVTGNGSLRPISKRSLLPSLTVLTSDSKKLGQTTVVIQYSVCPGFFDSDLKMDVDW